MNLLNCVYDKYIAEPHPYQQQALETFASEWIRAVRGKEPDVQATAQILATHIGNARHPNPAVYIWSTILAIHQYASDNPVAIDFMIRTYAEAAKLLPDTVTNEYGHGPQAGMQQLKWWIVEESDGFQGMQFPGSVGSPHPDDRSNLQFQESELSGVGKLDAVLDKVQEWKSERTSWIVSAAIQARCFALDVVRVNDGRKAEALIDAALERHPRWSKADFIGCCILLRGCARSLLECLSAGAKKDKTEQWRSKFTEFLIGGSLNKDDDFVTKVHAAVWFAPFPFAKVDHWRLWTDVWLTLSFPSLCSKTSPTVPSMSQASNCFLQVNGCFESEACVGKASIRET